MRPAASLRLRLGLGGLACLLIALGIAGIGLSSLFGKHAERLAQSELTQHFDQVIAGLTLVEGAPDVAGPLSDPRFARVYGGLYWQIDAGSAQSRSRSLWDATLERVEPGPQPLFLRLQGPREAELLARVQRILLPEALGGSEALVTVALDAQTLDRARQAFSADMLPWLCGLALVLMAAGAAQIQLGLRPLAQLRRRVGGLRSGATRRMGAGWPLEVAPLTREVDALLDQHDDEVRRARERAADLAHGLKTPLQAILGEAERLQQSGDGRAGRSLTDLVMRIRRQVDAELARTRHGCDLSGRCHPHVVARGVLSVLARLPEADRLDLEVAIPESLEVALPAEDLAELIGVLAENAVRHARSRVTIVGTKGAGVTLTIEDDGPGIPPGQRERLLARGVRLDEGGSGLGLSIARDIAERRGGALTLQDAPNGGLSVAVILPQAE